MVGIKKRIGRKRKKKKVIPGFFFHLELLVDRRRFAPASQRGEQAIPQAASQDTPTRSPLSLFLPPPSGRFLRRGRGAGRNRPAPSSHSLGKQVDMGVGTVCRMDGGTGDMGLGWWWWERTGLDHSNGARLQQASNRSALGERAGIAGRIGRLPKSTNDELVLVPCARHDAHEAFFFFLSSSFPFLSLLFSFPQSFLTWRDTPKAKKKKRRVC